MFSDESTTDMFKSGGDPRVFGRDDAILKLSEFPKSF